jgi:hypothetical protein
MALELKSRCAILLWASKGSVVVRTRITTAR